MLIEKTLNVQMLAMMLMNPATARVSIQYVKQESRSLFPLSYKPCLSWAFSWNVFRLFYD